MGQQFGYDSAGLRGGLGPRGAPRKCGRQLYRLLFLTRKHDKAWFLGTSKCFQPP